MSVKLMTTEQIQTNLASIYNMWPGGIPQEQVDQVNALKGELKRRGATAAPVQAQQPAQNQANQTPIEDMNTEQLTKELQNLSTTISKDPGNEELQDRFANVRFLLRNKLKNEQPVAPPVVQQANPQTNQTFMQEKTNGTNGRAEQGVMFDAQSQQQEAADRMLQMQQARARQIEDQMQLVRKHNLAKCAADVAGQVIRAIDIGEVDGDIIEEACSLGVKVAETIFAKVGL